MSLKYYNKNNDKVFVITDAENNPKTLISLSYKSNTISESLKFLKKKYSDAKAYQLYYRKIKNTVKFNGINVISILDFLNCTFL